MRVNVGDRLARRMCVWLNGEDVTKRTFYFSGPDESGVEGEGTLGLYVVEDGKFKFINGEVQAEYVTGKVKWELRPLD